MMDYAIDNYLSHIKYETIFSENDMITAKIIILGLLYVFSGGILYPVRFRKNKFAVVITTVVAIAGTWYLGKDIYDDIVADVSAKSSVQIQINQSSIPRFGTDYVYIDDDESFKRLNRFLDENEDKIVYFKLFIDQGYLNPLITNNEFAYQDNRSDRQVRYGFCPTKNTEYMICDAWIIHNSEIHKENVSNELMGYVDISGYYYVGTRQAPKTDLNITVEIPFSKRILRTVSFAKGFGS